MNLKFLREYGKDWIIEDNKVKLIGQYKRDFQSGKIKPKKIAGHRLYSFVSANKFMPSTISQMEMLGIIKPVIVEDNNVNMLSGQIAESEIVKFLNKQENSNNGTTYPYTAENQGNVFETTISDKFSALPDYITDAKHAVFSDKVRKAKKIHEIKSTMNNKWKRDEYKNFILKVVDNSLTEDNIIDNPNKDAIGKIFKNLSKKELSQFTKLEIKDIKDYIKNKKAKTPSKKFYVSLINKYGIQKWMVTGDIEHNLQPILKNTENIKVKPYIKEENFAKNKWLKNGVKFAPEEYFYQVSLYSFLYNMDKNKVLHPENVKGKYNTQIDVVFLDDNQMIIPKDSWINKFNYIYKKPKPIKIIKDKNFIQIPIEINLEKFYKIVINPCIKVWENTIDKQQTQELDYVAWAILKKAFRENGLNVDQFRNIEKTKNSLDVDLIKNTIKEYKNSLKSNEKDRADKKKLVDLFYKIKENEIIKDNKKIK